jgi:hypothetical protein
MDVMDAAVAAMPMEERSEFMTVISSYGIDPEREFFDNVIDKADCIFLGMAPVYLQRPDPCCVINRGEAPWPYGHDIF